MNDQAVVRHPIEGGQDPTIAVVRAVAALTDRLPTDLPVLHNAVQKDALDTLYASHRTSELTFAYAGCEVTVHDTSAVVATKTTD